MLLHDTARALARDVHVERRLFEILGVWSTGPGEPEVVALYATLSRHHGWRAEVLATLQPVLHDLDPSPPAAVDAYVATVASSSTTAERLAAVEVTLAAQVAGWEERIAHGTEVSDAPVMRALRLVSADAREDWRAAASLVRSLVRSGFDARGAAAHRSELEREVRVLG